MFVSDYFELDDKQFDKMTELGVFDAILEKDSNFFINIIRLKKTNIPEFKEAYQHINQFFSDIATLLDMADSPSIKDKMYKAARNKFNFHEVNGINLGFSSCRYGSGWGKEISDKFLYDAYQIVKKGSKQPEIFHLVSLFEENVAGDRLSDMIATIIEPEIEKYTLRVMSEIGISPSTHPGLTFLKNGLVNNPYKHVPILLLPEDILHKLPIARNWDEIDRVISENAAIRQEISAEIGEEWHKWASSEKKNYLKQNVFMNPDVCERVIYEYRDQDLKALDLKENPEYLAELFLKKSKKTNDYKRKISSPSSFEAMMTVIEIFKDWVENNRGWAEIQNSPSKRREKAVQRCLHLGAKYFIEVNNLDISCEADEGRGPIDFKISRGNDKTIAEVKLSSNGQYLHGFETQIKEYASAEKTIGMVYVFVDIGNPGRVAKISNLYNTKKMEGIITPELIIIDAKQKKAASTYSDLDMSTDFEIDNFPEMDLEIFDSDD